MDMNNAKAWNKKGEKAQENNHSYTEKPDIHLLVFSEVKDSCNLCRSLCGIGVRLCRGVE